jgi:hypothetical protein
MRRLGITVCVLLVLGLAPAAAVSLDGEWNGRIPAVAGCAGGADSTLTLAVAGSRLQGTVHNPRGDVPFSGSLDSDGSGTVQVARVTGKIRFDNDRFTMDWPGAQGCARHAEGGRAAPVPIFDNAPSQQIELTMLFMALCLEVYPDENALADVMSRQGGTPLAAAEFTRLLPIPGKSGRGWTIKGSKGSYVLLVSQGVEPSIAARMPNMKARACTMVSNGPAGMDPLPAFRSVKQQHADRKGIALLPPITNYTLPNDGAMELQQLGPASGIFMYSEVVKPETAPLKEFRMEFRQPE